MVAALVGSLAAGLGNPAWAAPTYRARVTGEQLVRDMMGAPDGGMNSMRRERAMGYLDGVMDAAAGLRWCPVGHAVPHELNYVVVEDLQRLRPDELRGGAAALVLDALSRRYPCSVGGKP